MPGLYRTYLQVPTEDLIIRPAQASIEDFLDHDPDVFNVRFKLVYEGVNSNGHRFTSEMLRKTYDSVVGKRINWEHGEPSIGYISSSKLIEATPNDPAHIVCEGTVWAHSYPEYADQIRASAEMANMGVSENGRVGISMECLYSDAVYVIGDYDETVPMEDDVNGMLASLVGKTLGGKLVTVQFTRFIFTGAAMTEKPAERKARLMAVASNKSVSDETELFAGLADSAFALSSLRMFPIDTKEHAEASVSYFDEVSGLIDSGVHQAQLVEAHERLLVAASSFGIDTTHHECLVCRSEGGIEHMRRDEEHEAQAELEEVTPAPEEQDPEEAPAEEVPAAEEEAPEADAEEAEAGEVEDDFDIRSAFNELLSRLDRLTTTEERVEVEASEESVEEADETARLEAQVEQLTQENAELNRKLMVQDRMNRLEKAGIEVQASESEARQKLLASLDEEGFEAYFNDLTKVKSTAKASAEDDVELFNIEDESAQTKREQYISLFKKD